MARLIQGFRDPHHRPTRRTIADGLARLEQEFGASPDMRRCRIHVPSQAGRPAQLAIIWHSCAEGEDLLIAYPFSRGCWASTTSGARVYLSLEALADAGFDLDGTVRLADGRSVHVVEFDIVSFPRDFTDFEHAIVALTVRFLNAEQKCFRYWPEIDFYWIDYTSLPQLSVQNVKGLTLYINAKIGGLPRNPGEPAFEPASLGKIQNTLSSAGIRKVRGRKSKIAA